MNKRKHSPKVLIEADKVRVIRSKCWNSEEKTNLLAALRTYGSTDIDNISRMLPKKTKPAIRMMIYKTMKKAETLSNIKDPALDEWLKLRFFKKETVPIPEALKYIELFEDHPSPEESGGFDFRAVYDYLHRMTLGYPAIDLPEGTLEKLNQLIDEVKEEICNSPDSGSEAIRYMATLEKKRDRIKSYPPRGGFRSSKIKNYSTNDEEANS